MGPLTPWVNWHLTNLKWRIRDLTNQIRKDAGNRIEVINVDEKDFNRPVGLEEEIGIDYKKFWDMPIILETFQKMNLLFGILIISLSILIWRMAKLDKFTDWKTRVINDYLLLISLTALVASFALLIYEAVQAKKGVFYTEKDTERANEWLKILGEDNRRFMPIWAKVLIFISLLIEAFVIAVTIIPVISSEIPMKLAVVIGSIFGGIAALLLEILSFRAGKSLHMRSIAKSLLNRMENEVKLGIRDEDISKKIKENKENRIGGWDVVYESKLYWHLARIESGEENLQSLKAKEVDNFVQVARNPFKGKGLLTLSFIFMLVIGGLLFFQRLQVQELLLAQQREFQELQLNIESQLEGLTDKDVEIINKASQDEDIEKLMEREAITKVGLLLVLFLLAYSSAVMFGYFYSFSCEKSEKFYRILKDYEKMKLHQEHIGNATSRWRRKVASFADKYFTKYFNALITEARSKGYNKLLEKLQNRGPYTLEKYIWYKSRKTKV